ncbi:SA0632 family lipoprotein [Staphylococcus pasteuri]
MKKWIVLFLSATLMLSACGKSQEKATLEKSVDKLEKENKSLKSQKKKLNKQKRRFKR